MASYIDGLISSSFTQDGKPAKRVHELAHAAFPEAKNLRPPNVARGLLTW